MASSRCVVLIFAPLSVLDDERMGKRGCAVSAEAVPAVQPPRNALSPIKLTTWILAEKGSIADNFIVIKNRARPFVIARERSCLYRPHKVFSFEALSLITYYRR